MKDSRKIIRHALLMPISALVLCAGSLAVAQTASTTYRSASQDPFTRYKPPVKRIVVKKAPMPIAPPSTAARIESYKAQKSEAMNRRQAVPKPTTALLLSEVQVTGIFRTPRGVAAMVEATPINLSYVIYPGEVFYDGMLVAIEETRLVFRRETRWTDGRRDVAVENKSLRQPNAYTDSMSAQKSDSEAAPKAEGGAAVSSEAPANKEGQNKESQSKEATEMKDNPNAKAVETLNSKVDKLLEMFKKQ